MSVDLKAARERLHDTVGLLRHRAREAPADLREAGSLRNWFFHLPGPGPWVMSWLRRRWVIFSNPKAHIEFQGPVYLGPRFSIDAPKGGTFIVGPGVEFRRGFRAELAEPTSRITIGAASVFTYDVVIQCLSSIDIGEHCTFAHAVMLVDGSHRFRDTDRPMMHQGYNLRPLTISDYVTVMSKATVIADIGERAFVGANTVVTKPVPPYSLVAGTAGRVIDYFGPPGQEPPGFTTRSESSASTSGSTDA